MKNINVVFDVNIWISIFIKQKYEFIEMLIFDYNITLCRSNELTSELVSVLSRKKIKKYFELDIIEYIAYYEKYSLLFLTKPVFADCIDPNDNYLFDLANQSGAKYLVTGDKIVLQTKTIFPLEVISFSDFRTMFK